MCGLSTVVTPAGASLKLYREIRSYANSIWDDNNNNNNRVVKEVPEHEQLFVLVDADARRIGEGGVKWGV